MRLRFFPPTILVFSFLAGQALAQELPPAATAKIDFKTQVQPLFEQRCYACHGPANQINGLRLDRKQDALKGGLSGPPIVPGDSAGSRLIQMVAGYRVKIRMPPGGDPLTNERIGMLRAWIDQGANWPDDAPPSQTAAPDANAKQAAQHWAWSPRTSPDPPAVNDNAAVRNPIDDFVLARLEKENIEPSPEADKLTLLRRVSLDLVGLPPSPGQVADFLADKSPDAYDRLVDSLLRSKHYGEKWAMHWLDQVRYADSDGYEKDNVRPRAWRYREWVIDALNDDMPFDEFTVDQIAGDLLPHPTTDQLVATGFHRNTLKNREGGVNFEQFRFEETIDRANTVGTVWLGLTVGCAQCHNHKYDPITQQDYYRFYAFFNNLEEDFVNAPMPGELGPYMRTHSQYRRRRDELLCEYGIPELQPTWEEKVKYHGAHPGEDTAWDVNWDTLAKMSDGGEKFIFIPADKRTERQKDVVTDYFLRFYNQVVSKERYKQLGFAELSKRLDDLKDSYPQVAEARVVFENPDPRQTHIHVRGQWDREGPQVTPGAPAFLPQIKAEQPTRLDLARWIVSPENPLTARVIVNRVWQEYFGKGLSSTSNDFGNQGEEPSHPALLDWLADDFIRSGWSLKHLHRTIVTSATYRQSSDVRPDLKERDPDNRLLARQKRLRLPAELIRDSALSAAGLLDDRIGGKSIHPPQPEGVAMLGYANSVKWQADEGPDRYRRGLYIHFQRTVPYPFLMTFDASERTLTECTRERSDTPLQALNLLNDPVFFEAAQGLATRVLEETPSDDFDARLDRAYRLCLGRAPTSTEQQRLAAYYRQQRSLLDSTPNAAIDWYPIEPQGFDRMTAAAWTGVSRVILNLDEFITRE